VDPGRAEMVAAHLESCSRCHVEAELLARVIRAIRRVRPDLDLEAYTRLVDAVDELTEPGPT
jgi:anti-sigma factor RsiW